MGQHAMNVIVNDMVPDPHMSDAEFIYQKDQARKRAEARGTQPNPNVGLVSVSRNMQTLMGGFCRFHGNRSQNQAAAKFRSLYESAQLGGGRACDPSVEPVDGGGVNPESVFERGADARKRLNEVRGILGEQVYRRVEFVIMGENGPTTYARWRFGMRSPDGRAIGRGQVEVRDYMDLLARAWGFRT